MRDNDGVDPLELRETVKQWLDGNKRELFIGAVADGHTLEPQLIKANGEEHLREVLGITARASLDTWMTREKTEGAMRIAESDKSLTPPRYITAAAEFIQNA
jgi:hypothetical protein